MSWTMRTYAGELPLTETLVGTHDKVRIVYDPQASMVLASTNVLAWARQWSAMHDRQRWRRRGYPHTRHALRLLTGVT